MRASILALVGLLGACPAKDAERSKARDSGGDVDAMAGVRVPLPPGWVASVESPDVLALGPPGKLVMKIERSRAEAVPRLAEVRTAFLGELPSARVQTVEEREDGRGFLWRGRLQFPGDRPGREGTSVMLGARRMGSDVALCSTVYGASDAEVERAARTCEGLPP